MAIVIQSEPDKILAEFLRAYCPEPVRQNFSLRQTQIIETFDGTGAQTVFTVGTLPLNAVVDVKIATVSQQKFAEYSFDLRAGTITFATAPPSGTDNIEITYITGSNWIFPDRPDINLSKGSYPRVSVEQIDGSQEVLGMFDDQTWDSITIQIDVWTKENLKVTFNSQTLANQDVVDLIARQIQQTLRDNWRTRLCPDVLTYPIKITQISLDYDRDRGLYRTSMRYTFKVFDAGEYAGV